MEHTQVDWRGVKSWSRKPADSKLLFIYLCIYLVCSSTLRSITAADTALTGKYTLCLTVGTREGAWGNQRLAKEPQKKEDREANP